MKAEEVGVEDPKSPEGETTAMEQDDDIAIVGSTRGPDVPHNILTLQRGPKASILVPPLETFNRVSPRRGSNHETLNSDGFSDRQDSPVTDEEDAMVKREVQLVVSLTKIGVEKKMTLTSTEHGVFSEADHCETEGEVEPVEPTAMRRVTDICRVKHRFQRRRRNGVTRPRNLPPESETGQGCRNFDGTGNLSEINAESRQIDKLNKFNIVACNVSHHL